MTLPGLHKALRVADLDDTAGRTLRLPDRLGRSQGHWVGIPTYAVMMAKWGIRVRKVPSQFWSLDATAAVVACPCGETPVVEALVMIPCACERYFYFDGADVWAFASPPQPEPKPDVPEESPS